MAAPVASKLRGPRVIIALDYAAAAEALALVQQLSPDSCRLKVGLELFTAGGPAVVRELIARGYDVFLDLKLHDIPNTVARACTAAAGLGVWMLNVHTLGGPRMLEAARQALSTQRRRPLLVGVTLLTSHTPTELAELGIGGELPGRVEALGALACSAGLDGVVCSPLEAAALRRRFGKGFVLVTPGVRPAGSGNDDQARTLSPRQAVAAGADYLVIGRPVTRAAEPRAALAVIERELAELGASGA